MSMSASAPVSMSVSVPVKEKAAKTTSSAKSPGTQSAGDSVITIGSMAFEHAPNPATDQYPTTIVVIVDIGSSVGKGRGLLKSTYGGTAVNYELDYPSTHDALVTQFLSVKIKGPLSEDLLEEAKGGTERFFEVTADNCVVKCTAIPKDASETGIKLPKIALCQSPLSPSEHWVIANNEVHLRNTKTGVSYRYFNLGEIPSTMITNLAESTVTPTKNYAVIAWNIVTFKKITGVVADVVAALARRFAETHGIVAARGMLQAGVKLFIVNAMPIGTPLSAFNDFDLTAEIAAELEKINFVADQAGVEIKALQEDVANSTKGKFDVHYTVCNETIQGMTKCVLEFNRRKTGGVACAIDCGHSTAQQITFALVNAERDPRNLIFMTGSSTTEYGGVNVVHRAFSNWLAKISRTFDEFLWSQNSAELANCNYELMTKLLCGEIDRRSTIPILCALGKDGKVNELKIDMDAVNTEFDMVMAELLKEKLEEMAKGLFFKSSINRGRLLSTSGRLLRYEFRSGEHMGKNVARVLAEISEKNLPGIQFSAVDSNQVGTGDNIQDVAKMLSVLCHDSSEGHVYRGPSSPRIYPCLVLLERFLTDDHNTSEHVTKILRSTVCDMTKEDSYDLCLQSEGSDIEFAEVYICAASLVDNKPQPSVICKACAAQLEGTNSFGSTDNIDVVPMFRVKIPAKAHRGIKFSLVMIGTFYAVVSFSYYTVDNLLKTGSRLVTFPVPDLSRISRGLTTVSGEIVSYKKYKAARTEKFGSPKSQSGIIEELSVCHVDMPGEINVDKYPVSEFREFLVAEKYVATEQKMIIPQFSNVRGVTVSEGVSLKVAAPVVSRASSTSAFAAVHKKKKKDVTYVSSDDSCSDDDDDAVQFLKSVDVEQKEKLSPVKRKHEKPKRDGEGVSSGKLRKFEDDVDQKAALAKKKADAREKKKAKELEELEEAEEKRKADEKEKKKKKAKELEETEAGKKGAGIGKKKKAGQVEEAKEANVEKPDSAYGVKGLTLPQGNGKKKWEKRADERVTTLGIVLPMEKAVKTAPIPGPTIVFEARAEDVMNSGDETLVHPTSVPEATEFASQEIGAVPNIRTCSVPGYEDLHTQLATGVMPGSSQGKVPVEFDGETVQSEQYVDRIEEIDDIMLGAYGSNPIL